MSVDEPQARLGDFGQIGVDHLERLKRHNRGRYVSRRKYWSENDRESYACAECGSGEGDEDVSVIHVHHIDGNPCNTTLRNLVGLCRSCHLERHGMELGIITLAGWKEAFLSLGDGNVDERDVRETDTSDIWTGWSE